MSVRAVFIAALALLTSMGVFGYWAASDMQKMRDARAAEQRQEGTQEPSADRAESATLDEGTTAGTAGGPDASAPSYLEETDAGAASGYGQDATAGGAYPDDAGAAYGETAADPRSADTNAPTANAPYGGEPPAEVPDGTGQPAGASAGY